ncbi:EAL domain-containing protein [Oscillatoria acuminata]|uniref:PAS domain S-box/diguanylate cyclase (GGDEF) domain-containing protein n=1 Tax=Oscillatoria acuminata PCC 6304 TaxID=56110 RepID=K9TNS4_9CYAN|nr:EAL domain-containing protein [Oscillatoria acuminata]AFY83771.1 PAS domain S-box/diguanylate cyclase (GGDEF) domain-containing protein [Oscillatoria acuminata PCC 6304]
MKQDLADEWEFNFAGPSKVIVWTSPCLVCSKLFQVRVLSESVALAPVGELEWVFSLVVTTLALLYLAIARYRKSRLTATGQQDDLPEDPGKGQSVPQENSQGLLDPGDGGEPDSRLNLAPETAESSGSFLPPLFFPSSESRDPGLQFWQFHIQRMPLAHILFDTEGRFLGWNAGAERLFGYSSQEVLGQTSDLIVPPERRSQIAQLLQRLTQGDLNAHSINENLTKSGQTIICEWYNTPLFKHPGRFAGILSMVQDITDRWESELTLQSVNREMTTLLNAINEVVLLFDARGCYLKILPTDSPLLERAASQLVGKTLHEVFESTLADRFLDYIQRTIQEQKSCNLEYELTLGDRLVTFSAKLSPLNGDRVLWVARDITDRKHIQALLRRYAFTDPLTGLANRCSFVKRLGTAMHNAYNDLRATASTGEVHSPKVAVLLLDIDRFRIVKYSLGHWVADRLLVATAKRLQSCLNPGATLARIGGDEFAILLTDITTLADVIQLADRIQSAMRFPFSLDEHEIFSSVSIGIALDNGGYARSGELLRDADTALHYAKQQGQGQYVSFAQDMHEGAIARLQLETELQRAIARTAHPNSPESQPFQVYYQPIVSLSTGNIVGFEALVRWHHPIRGFISPGEFIPVAEETGQIGAIDRWVMNEACRQLGWWQQRYPAAADLTMSVNVSGVNFAQVGIIERIEQTLRSSGICGRYLKLEITESVIMKNTGAALALLDRIKALGINLSIDDFGTGYSSLARLHELPINTLKIDRSFVNRMRGLDESSDIVQTTIALAHTLGLDAIAEGVETSQQVELLRTLDCDYAQGYFFSKPVDSEAALNLILSDRQLFNNG